MICRWKSIKRVSNQEIRKFYLFCVSLLIDAPSLSVFEARFSNLCIITSHKFQDTVLRNGKTVFNIRKDLERCITNRLYYDSVIQGGLASTDDGEAATENDHNFIYSPNYEASPVIVTWINNIKQSAEDADLRTQWLLQ